VRTDTLNHEPCSNVIWISLSQDTEPSEWPGAKGAAAGISSHTRKMERAMQTGKFCLEAVRRQGSLAPPPALQCGKLGRSPVEGLAVTQKFMSSGVCKVPRNFLARAKDSGLFIVSQTGKLNTALLPDSHPKSALCSARRSPLAPSDRDLSEPRALRPIGAKTADGSPTRRGDGSKRPPCHLAKPPVKNATPRLLAPI